MKHEPENLGCSGKCSSCPASAAAPAGDGELQGGPLVLAALGLFLLPLLGALAGAALAGGDGWTQLPAALGGFFLSLLLVKGGMALGKRRTRP